MSLDRTAAKAVQSIKLVSASGVRHSDGLPLGCGRLTPLWSAGNNAAMDRARAEYRQAIVEYIRVQALPPDKFSHQPRLHHLARSLGESCAYDDDVLHAAAWLHDIGVFVGNRPENPDDLASWDHVAYAIRVVPGLLTQFGFPTDRIGAVIEAIRTHLPSMQPASMEGTLLRDADILEQLGGIGIVRALSKVGRDTRYPTYGEALRVIRKNALELPDRLQLPVARQMAGQRVALMTAFLQAIDAEAPTGEL